MLATLKKVFCVITKPLIIFYRILIIDINELEDKPIECFVKKKKCPNCNKTIKEDKFISMSEGRYQIDYYICPCGHKSYWVQGTLL